MALNRFGFWINVTDHASAREAVRMAGLPVLLIGVSILVRALSLAAAPDAALRPVFGLAICGVAIIVVAFAIRGGRAALVPVATGASAVLLLANIALTPTVLAIVPILALLLCISGLRGWLWLRHHR